MVSQRIQELFKQACLLTAIQGTQAYYNGGCRYLTPDGNKCAVGQVLPDGHAAQHARMSVSTLCVNFPDVAELLGVDNSPEGEAAKALWSRLQRVHDYLKDVVVVQYWEVKWGICRPFGVQWSEMFWAHARKVSQQAGFDIGNYPRDAINEARVA